jgi:DNA invertase Pin-like site-specific DNA recombinase
VNALADLAAYGVAFVSLRDNLDLSTPSGRLMFQIIGAMSEFERALIQERLCAGLHHARPKGKVLGRPRTAVDIARVKTLRGDGMSWRRIARELGISVSVAFKTGAASVGSNVPDGSGQATAETIDPVA